jgi:hypothetical protein
MGIRDEEIKRLIHYAKGLGVRVIIYNKDDKIAQADWTLDGTLIRVYTGGTATKTDIILSLIHELGHQLWWIYLKNRQPDLKFEQAIERQNLFYEDSLDNPAPKDLRKKIFDVEKAGTDWWISIYKETAIKIPEWKLYAAMEFDMWMYEIYYEEGHFPKGMKKKKKYVEIQKKWREKWKNQKV